MGLIHYIAIFLSSFSIVLPANALFAVMKPDSLLRVHEFPVPPAIGDQVWFWEMVFSRYPSTSVLIHDSEHPHLILDIVDFEAFSGRFKNRSKYSRSEREKIVSKYVRRYELAISRFKSDGRAATRYGGMEKRVYAVYAKNPKYLDHLYSGAPTIRGQAGLKDEFERAAVRAQQYLPYMERIFRQKGLPVDLTRLAFVESMFNLNAVSKVGASGIWQFMPATARSYLIVNPFFDERNSPTKASRAAASLLQFNQKELGTWPLAITAYNHGAASIAKAVRQLGTKDIDQIVTRYRAPSFGFASRNFYAEFIAARNIYNRVHADNHSPSRNPLGIATVTLTNRISLRQFLDRTTITKEILRKYNPCIKERAFAMLRQVHLPARYELLVPKDLALGVEKALLTSVKPKRG